MTLKNSLKDRIEDRINQLDTFMKSGDYNSAYFLIPDILKFDSILTEEQSEFVRATKYAIEHNLDWVSK